MSVKVLIADSSQDVRELLKRVFLSDTFDVFKTTQNGIFEAKDGLEAFGFIGKYPDIEYFFADIDMKHLKGDELLEVLIDTGKLKNSKVIFMSNTDISKKLPTNLKKYVLGTLIKPLDEKKLGATIAQIVKNSKDKEASEKEQVEKLFQIQNEQKRIIKNIAEKYYTLSKVEQPIDLNILQNVIDTYINPDDFIPNEDLMIIIAPIMSEFFMEMGLNIKVDNYKLQFLFDNQKIDVKVEKSSAQQDVFEVNVMNDPDLPKYDFGGESIENMVSKIEVLKQIDITIDPTDIVAKRLDPIMTYIKKEGASIGDSKKSLDYLRMKCFMFKAYQMLIDMDFTIDSTELRDMKKKIEKIVADIEYLTTFRDKNSPEYIFNEIYSPYQKEFLLYKYTADTLFKNRDENKQYRTLIEKLDKLVKFFIVNETKLFYSYFIKQLQKVIVSFYEVLNKLTYQFDFVLWQKARESNSVKNFFREKRIAGSLCTKSLLNYYVKVNKVSDDEKSQFASLASMLENSNPKNVVYLSNNVKESSIIEQAISNIDTNWKLYTLAKLSLIDAWFTGNELPDILIIDSNFDMEVENVYELLKWLYKKYPQLEKIQPQVLMAFNKISIESVEKASVFGIREYLKRPFVEAEIRNKLRFM